MSVLSYLPKPASVALGPLWVSLIAHPLLCALVVVLALFIMHGAPLVREFRHWDAMRLRERRSRGGQRRRRGRE